MIMQQKSSWKWYAVLAAVFLTVISFNFTKPFGFFRESNPALVAITANYWQENPDIRKQHIPIYSYAFDKNQPASTQFDNTITTFGYAWFAVPYYFLQLTNIPIGPVGLRIFSALWLFLTVIAIYKLATLLIQSATNNRIVTFFTVALYVFSPVVMWYQVNGHVHETAVLPFYYFAWYFFLRLLQDKKAKWLWLTALLLFLGIQFDWLPFFQAMVMSCYLLFSRKEKLPKWMFLIPGASVAIGMSYILYHYASWGSLQDYLNFMKWKFGSRTVGERGPSYISFLPPSLNIFFFYVLSYGGLLVFAIIGLFKKKLSPLVWLMIITAILHHLVLWGFSSEHDYAALKMAFPLAFLTALLISGMKKKNAIVSATMIIFFAIIQYLLLHNYPYRKGMYEDEAFFYKAGTAVKKFSSDSLIFVNTQGMHFPQVEFYAGRTYIAVESIEDAMRKYKEIKTNKSARYINILPKGTNDENVLWQSYVLNAQVSDTIPYVRDK
jgi:hypothetical protein